MTEGNADVVRALLSAYRAQDREAAERLLAPDFVFTSPQDDRIDRAAYFARCFPTSERFASQEVEHVVETGEEVVLVYRYRLRSGEVYRNVEIHRVRDASIVEVQVFFGGQLPEQ